MRRLYHGKAMTTFVENYSESPEIEAFFRAVERGDFAAVKKTVEENPSAVNWESDQGFAPLHFAILCRNAETREDIAFYLIDKGANPDKLQPWEGGVPMVLFAISWNREDIALKLVDAGADLTWKNPGGPHELMIAGTTLLMSAAGQSSLRLMQALIDRGADLEARDAKGQTALMYAAESGKPEPATLLIANGAVISARNGDGEDMRAIAGKGLHGASVAAVTEAFNRMTEEATQGMREGLAQPIVTRKPLRLLPGKR
jgi:uncharacterized protein